MGTMVCKILMYEQEVWTRWSPGVPSNLNCPVILWFSSWPGMIHLSPSTANLNPWVTADLIVLLYRRKLLYVPVFISLGTGHCFPLCTSPADHCVRVTSVAATFLYSLR